MTTKTVGISEIFSSWQGEGPHLGERHLFIRFERCNIHCDYCDELWKPASEMDLGAILDEVKRIDQEEGPHAFVSLTGGEPLYYGSFLKLLCPELARLGLRIYLETSGILWKPLEEIIQWTDVVAMDMKPASVTHERNFFNEHKRFLEIARKKETFVKIIVSHEIDLSEYRECCKIIQAVNPAAPLILQPISLSSGEGHDDPALMRLLNELQRIGNSFIPNVRVIPRLHKIMNVR